MSDLTDKIVAEHEVLWISGSGGREMFGCKCGARSENDESVPFAASHMKHLAEHVEAAVLASVKPGRPEDWDEDDIGILADAILDLPGWAEGGQRS